MTAWGSPRSKVPSASARSMVVCPHPNPLPEGEGTAALDGAVGVPSPSPYAAHPVDADHVPSPSPSPTGEGTGVEWCLLGLDELAVLPDRGEHVLAFQRVVAIRAERLGRGGGDALEAVEILDGVAQLLRV